MSAGPLNGINQTTGAFKPRDLDDAQLTKLNHSEWLEEFSKILALNTGINMTPKRQGMITRLHWSSLYVKLLEKTLKKQNEHVAKLEGDLTKALAVIEHQKDLPAAPRPPAPPTTGEPS